MNKLMVFCLVISMEMQPGKKIRTTMQILAIFQAPDNIRSVAMDWVEFANMIRESDSLAPRFFGRSGGIPVFRLCALLKGGKGGFGKLLKSQKNIGKKTDNFDSCRDLQGRRLRNANQEEKLRKFKEQKEKEDEIVKSLQASSSDTKPVVALDEKYTQQLINIEKQKVSAVVEGMRNAAVPQHVASSSAPKAKKLILFDDESVSD